MFKSGHHRPLTNDRGRVSHFYCFQCCENVNSRLSRVNKAYTQVSHVHNPSMALLLCSGWSHEIGVRVIMEVLTALCVTGNNPPNPCSLINQAGFILSGRVLWCPSHVSFQSPDGLKAHTVPHLLTGHKGDVCAGVIMRLTEIKKESKRVWDERE